MALADPAFIQAAAKEFGSQCVVISIDVKVVEGVHQVMTDCGRATTGKDPVAWARQAEQQGAGEILLNSIDRDGMRNGYDLELIAKVADSVKIPVIACGGVGEWEHFAEALGQTGADALAAANIFHYTDQSVYMAKKFLAERNSNFRPPNLLVF